MKLRVLMAVLVVSQFSGLADAQTPKASHIRGSIDSVDGQTLSVSTREGPKVKLILMSKVRIIAMKKAELSAITPGSFIGTAAKPGAGGQLVAMEVVLFSESARGSGEGQYDWDLAPGSSMTNAKVDAAVQGASGSDLTLSFKGGSVKISVPPGVPVVTPIPAQRDDLRPGAQVFALGLEYPDGTYRTPFVAVSKDGVAPPM
jgi:hypothetical protein